jgi:hypothetical protein
LALPAATSAAYETDGKETIKRSRKRTNCIVIPWRHCERATKSAFANFAREAKQSSSLGKDWIASSLSGRRYASP